MFVQPTERKGYGKTQEDKQAGGYEGVGPDQIEGRNGLIGANKNQGEKHGRNNAFRYSQYEMEEKRAGQGKQACVYEIDCKDYQFVDIPRGNRGEIQSG